MNARTEVVMIVAMTVLAIATGNPIIEGMAFGVLMVRICFRGFA